MIGKAYLNRHDSDMSSSNSASNSPSGNSNNNNNNHPSSSPKRPFLVNDILEEEGQVSQV